jgi:hypothetical protein
MNDSRYRLNVSSRHEPSTVVSSWYETTSIAPCAPGTSSILLSGGSITRHDAAADKKSAPFSKEKVKRLENRDTSDGSDGGPCYSDYERDTSKKAGEKGSCKPKGKKAKTTKTEKGDGDSKS